MSADAMLEFARSTGGPELCNIMGSHPRTGHQIAPEWFGRGVDNHGCDQSNHPNPPGCSIANRTIPPKAEVPRGGWRAVRTLFATIGYEPRSILPTILAHYVKHVILFHFDDGEPREARAAARKLAKDLKALDVSCEPVELQDGFDFARCLDEILHQAKRVQGDPGSDLIFDITGGTKVTALAAFSVAWILGKPVVYNVESRPDAPNVRIPIEGLQDHASVGPKTEEVLRALLAMPPDARGERSASPAELQGSVRLKRASTVVFHVNRLEKMGALRRVREESDHKQVRYTATPAARVLAIALEARRSAGPKLAPPTDRRRKRRQA